MRRRLEPRAPADAASWQQRHPVRADEPSGRLCRVARVRVLRQQADETTVEMLVQRRKQERQNGLGHARPRRQGSRKGLQPLEREQLSDERVKYRTVHGERRKPGFRRSSVYDAAVSERAGESMTVTQRDALAAELAELEGPKRAEMVEAIATARGFGDLSENFAYHDAKNEQGLLERRITILRSRIENAVIVEHAAEGVVGVGSVVEVEDEQGGRFEVEISSVGGVSTDSPLGGALIGAKAGDTVEVKAPKGAWKARIVSVRSS
jgi:transcription elongation factor GreA